MLKHTSAPIRPGLQRAWHHPFPPSSRCGQYPIFVLLIIAGFEKNCNLFCIRCAAAEHFCKFFSPMTRMPSALALSQLACPRSPPRRHSVVLDVTATLADAAEFFDLCLRLAPLHGRKRAPSARHFPRQKVHPSRLCLTYGCTPAASSRAISAAFSGSANQLTMFAAVFSPISSISTSCSAEAAESASNCRSALRGPPKRPGDAADPEGEQEAVERDLLALFDGGEQIFDLFGAETLERRERLFI